MTHVVRTCVLMVAALAAMTSSAAAQTATIHGDLLKDWVGMKDVMVKIAKAMADSFDYGAAVIKEFDNTTIQGTVNAPFMGASTRARVMFFLLGHTWDTYGQMAVYLRLNGGVPPASQRP